MAGTGNLTRSLEKNAELTAKLSKKEYLPGEEIEVEITAPYTGSGLLTIERDKASTDHVWFEAKTTTTVQKIKLPKDSLKAMAISTSPLCVRLIPAKST